MPTTLQASHVPLPACNKTLSCRTPLTRSRPGGNELPSYFAKSKRKYAVIQTKPKAAEAHKPYQRTHDVPHTGSGLVVRPLSLVSVFPWEASAQLQKLQPIKHASQDAESTLDRSTCHFAKRRLPCRNLLPLGNIPTNQQPVDLTQHIFSKAASASSAVAAVAGGAPARCRCRRGCLRGTARGGGDPGGGPAGQ